LSSLAAPKLEITPAHRAHYKEEGYMLLERAIPEEHLQLLRDECTAAVGREDAKMDAQGVDVNGIIHRGSRYFISHPSHEAPRLFEFLYSDAMAEICRATIGPDAWVFWEQYVVKAADKGHPFAWHQDSGYVFPHQHKPYLTCWIALDDMYIENGTVYILPFSRTGIRTMVEHKPDPVLNDLVGYFGKDPGDPVLVPAGSIAAFTSVTFHRSGPNVTPKQRRVYVAQYSGELLLKHDGTPWGRTEPFLKDGRCIATPPRGN